MWFGVQIGFCGRDQATEDVGFVLFSFFNVLWASIYVEAWKRYSAELAYRWGTLDQRDELLVEPRPLFTVSATDRPPLRCTDLCICCGSVIIIIIIMLKYGFVIVVS
jgi:anoctamin-8